VSALPLYLMPWCASKRDFRPRRIATVSSTRARARRSSGNAATARDPSRIRRGTRCRSWRRCISGRPKKAPVSAGSRRRASRPMPRRADKRVDFIDEQDRVRVVDQLLQHRLQPLLEIAAVTLVPASSAPMSSMYTWQRARISGPGLDDTSREALGQWPSCPRPPRPRAEDCSCACGTASG